MRPQVRASALTNAAMIHLVCKASSPLYCDVKPQKLAVFTTNKTLPLYWHKDRGFSSCKRYTVWFNKAGYAVVGMVTGPTAMPADPCVKQTTTAIRRLPPLGPAPSGPCDLHQQTVNRACGTSACIA